MMNNAYAFPLVLNFFKLFCIKTLNHCLIRSDVQMYNNTICFEKCKSKAFDMKRILTGYTYWTDVSQIYKYR